MSDVESDYSSSSEGDEDYVPSGDDDSGDDLEGLVEEDALEEGSEQTAKKRGSKSTGKEESSTRRRKGWSALEEEIKTDDPEAARRKREEEELRQAEAKRKEEEAKKKKADDLWSSFLSDVGTKPKPKAAASKSQPDISKADTPTTSNTSEKAGNSTSAKDKPKSESNGDKSSNTIKITQVMDFAGEEVRVTKEVEASSKEAKNYLKQQEKISQQPVSSTVLASQSLPPKPGLPSGLKRPGAGIGNVLGQIGKKKKIGVLEKSKMDWDSFKHTEGIGEELKIHNKGKEGYVERQRFLQRADVRQYEIERDMRLAQSKINR